MATKKTIDTPTRLRIAAHLRRHIERVRKVDPEFDQVALAKQLGVATSTVSRALNLTGRSLGLDFVLAVNRRLGIDAQILLNHDPPHE